jgi:hypothetical protein
MGVAVSSRWFICKEIDGIISAATMLGDKQNHCISIPCEQSLALFIIDTAIELGKYVNKWRYSLW